MSKVTFKKIKEFGQIHKNQKRIVIVTLQESRVEENGEEKVNTYISFHEHYMTDEGKLLPRKVDNPKAKYKEKVISFNLPFTRDLADEFAAVAKDILAYISKKPEPANKDKF